MCKTKWILFIFVYSIICLINKIYAQQIIDSCFTSVTENTFQKDKSGHKEIKTSYIVTSNAGISIWTGTAHNSIIDEHIDSLSFSEDFKLPSHLRNSRSAFLGFSCCDNSPEWIAFKLSKPLSEGNIVSFNLTYIKTRYKYFQPSVYTGNISKNLYKQKKYKKEVFFVKKMPKAYDKYKWQTKEVNFIVTNDQVGHEWLIIDAGTEAGAILNFCLDTNDIYGSNKQQLVTNKQHNFFTDTNRYIIQNLTFKSNSDIIETDSFIELNRILQFLQNNDSLKINIEGYTDNVGEEKKNINLSYNRAKSVFIYFVSQGISENRLNVHGNGSSNPIATNDTEEGRALNRRVELVVR